MDKKEFLKLLNECIQFKLDDHPDSIFYYYDEKLIRRKKLNSLNGNNEPITIKNIIKEQILFDQDQKTKILWIDYDRIWVKIKEKHNTNYDETQSLITSWLDTPIKMKEYTPSKEYFVLAFELDTPIKMKEYTPLDDKPGLFRQLDIPIKIKEYIPTMVNGIVNNGLDAPIKIKEYTPKNGLGRIVFGLRSLYKSKGI